MGNWVERTPATPHPPKHAAPPGACDAHFHVFVHDVRYPLSPKRGYDPANVPLSAFRAMQKTLGLSRGVLVHPSCYGSDNALLADVLRENDDLRGVAVIDADTTQNELEQLSAAGVKGIRIAARTPGGVSFDNLERLAEKIAPFGWHIQIYAYGNKWPEWAPRMIKIPGTFVLDHLAGMTPDIGPGTKEFDALCELLETGRVWVKLSAPYRMSALDAPYPDTIPIGRALVAARADRLVWGSDWPNANYPPPRALPDAGMLLDVLAQWAPNEAVRNRILVDAPAELYGFPQAVRA